MEGSSAAGWGRGVSYKHGGWGGQLMEAGTLQRLLPGPSHASLALADSSVPAAAAAAPPRTHIRKAWPLSAPCAADDNHIDIPVPDFTYACYPETRYK